MYVMLKFYRSGNWVGEYRDGGLGEPKENARYSAWHWTIMVRDGRIRAWSRKAHEGLIRAFCPRVEIVPPVGEKFPPFDYEKGAIVAVFLDWTRERGSAKVIAWVGQDDPFNVIRGTMSRDGRMTEVEFRGDDEREIVSALNALEQAGAVWAWLVARAEETRDQSCQERAARDTAVALEEER